MARVRSAIAVILVLSFIVVFSGAAPVAVGPSRAQTSAVDPRARTALNEMRAAYRSVEKLHVKVKWTAKYTGDMSADDFPLPGPDVLEVRMQRPNKFYMLASAKRSGKASSYAIVSDGASLWYWRSGTNAYTQTRAPATLSEMAGLLPRDAIGTVDGNDWTADSILEWMHLVEGIDPVMQVPEGVTVTMAAPEKIGRAPVDVVRTRSTDAVERVIGVSQEINLYLATASRLIQGYTISVRGKNEDTGKAFSVAMQAIYDVHETQPRFTAADFTFTPPPGAKKAGGGL